MRWSKLKQLVEDRMAPSLQGRVEVHSTRYYSGEGRGWITVDKREVAEFSTLGTLMRVHRLAIERSGSDFWDAEGGAHYRAMRSEVEATLQEDGAYHQWGYHRALWDSLSLSISDAMLSDEMLIRAFAMLDSRLGKRRLRTLQLRDDEHLLVRQFYELRCEAEDVKQPTTIA
ncbi:MAG: SF0329 family protein [Thermomicrobiales bacterium]